MGETREGGRRCGQVRFEVSAPEMLTMVCHCRGGQRMSGGAFALGLTVPAAGFAVTAGEPVIGGMHGDVQHFHCPHCMSWVFTRPPGVPIVNVRTTMLDAPGDAAPFLEMCAAEKLAWVSVPAAHSFPGFPPNDAWPGLIASYGQAQAAAG